MMRVINETLNIIIVNIVNIYDSTQEGNIFYYLLLQSNIHVQVYTFTIVAL